MRGWKVLLICVGLISVFTLGQAIVKYTKTTEKEIIGVTIDFDSLEKVEHLPNFELQEGQKYEDIKYVDLNGDGQIEEIKYMVECTEHSCEATLSVNGTSIILPLTNPGRTINIIDINDDEDNLKEIDVYEDGPSGDPVCHLFWFDNDRIKEVGKILNYNYYLDKKGRIYTSHDKIYLFDPKIVVGWMEIDNSHKLTYHYTDSSSYLHRDYIINYPKDSDNSPWRIYGDLNSSPYGTDYLYTVNDGQVVTLLNVINQGTREVAFKIAPKDEKPGWLIHIYGGD